MSGKQLLPLFFLSLLLNSRVQAQSSRHFADRVLLGFHYGADRDWEGERDNRFEISRFLGPRAGVSINDRLYAGIQARFISARNFETPWQNFYMAGVWGRGYLLRQTEDYRPNRWNLFLETGFLSGNFTFENKNFIEYYERRSGQWYIPVVIGMEFRLYRQLTLEACVHGYYNNGKSWDQYGIAYISAGLNYRLGK